MVLLINEKAGLAAWEQKSLTLEQLNGLFRDQGVFTQVKTLGPGVLADVVRQALAGEWDAVIAGGGDGTAGCLAGAVAGTGIPLGVLPLGTYNHFARDLNLPPDLKGAIHSLATSSPKQVDLAEVNGNVFVNNSSIGIYPRVVEEREFLRRATGLSKRVSMMWAGIKVLFRRPVMRVRIEMNGSRIDRMTPFVFVGNNRYTLGLGERFRRRLDEGCLSVFAARALGIWGLGRLAWHALRDRLHASQELEAWHPTELRIHTHKHTVRVALDGEVLRLQSPLCYRVHPRALRVLAPI